MKYTRFYRPSVRLGKHGHPMRDPNGHDGMSYDITQDLTDGRDGALADNVPQNGFNATQQAPAGTQSVFGRDAQPQHAETPQQGTQKPTPPAKEPSLREQLSSAFKGTEGEPTNQQQAQSANPQQAAPPALTKDGEGKYRNPDGTFASTEQVAAFEAAQAGTQQQQQTPTTQASPVLAQMTAAEAQQFQSLPAELQQYVGRTMEDLNTRAARYSEYDLIEQSILGPRRQAFQAEGTTPAVALNQLFAMSDFAGRDPGNFVLWFSQQRGLDLDALLDARDAAQSANPVDPRVQQLEGQVQQLAGTVQQFQNGAQQQAHQANLNAVQAFATAQDANGTLLRPHLTDVMDGWAAQITAVRAANPNMPNDEVLQKAYDNACWSDPNVRGKMQQAANAQAQAAEAARVQAARQAGSSVTGAPAGEASTIPNNSNRSIREELESQFAAARAV